MIQFGCPQDMGNMHWYFKYRPYPKDGARLCFQSAHHMKGGGELPKSGSQSLCQILVPGLSWGGGWLHVPSGRGHQSLVPFPSAGVYHSLILCSFWGLGCLWSHVPSRRILKGQCSPYQDWDTKPPPLPARTGVYPPPPRKGYAAFGTPRAVSRRRTFLW